MSDKIEAGLYTNIFEIGLPDKIEADLFVRENSTTQIMQEIEDSFPIIKEEGKIYFSNKKKVIYYYGNYFHELITKKGFESKRIEIISDPEFISKILSESILKSANQQGFTPVKQKIGLILIENNVYGVVSNGAVKILKGFTLDFKFLRDPESKKIIHTISVDSTYFIKDSDGRGISTKDLVEKYEENALKEMKLMQKEYLLINGQCKINSEISRQRLLEDVIPFIERIKNIYLIFGGKTTINNLPIRVVIGN